MVKVYGTSAAESPERRQVNVARQILASIGIIGLAVVVCVALIGTAEFKAQKPVALFGIGSGEEQEGANAVFTAFETFKGQTEGFDSKGEAFGDDTIKKVLEKEYYEEEFVEAEKETENNVKEVGDVIKEAEAEHAALEAFATGSFDAPVAFEHPLAK